MHTPTSALAATTALMVTALKRTAALTPALLLVLTGCVGPFVPPPGPVPSVSGPAPVPSSAPACTAPESTVAPDAKYLVGEWICTGSTTEMRFRFSADGAVRVPGVAGVQHSARPVRPDRRDRRRCRAHLPRRLEVQRCGERLAGRNPGRGDPRRGRPGRRAPGVRQRGPERLPGGGHANPGGCADHSGRDRRDGQDATRDRDPVGLRAAQRRQSRNAARRTAVRREGWRLRSGPQDGRRPRRPRTTRGPERRRPRGRRPRPPGLGHRHSHRCHHRTLRRRCLYPTPPFGRGGGAGVRSATGAGHPGPETRVVHSADYLGRRCPDSLDAAGVQQRGAALSGGCRPAQRAGAQ